MEEKILQHYKNWLSLRKQMNNEQQNNENITTNEPLQQVAEVEPTSENNETEPNESYLQFPIDSHNAVKVYENNQIEIYVKKSFHQRQTKFRLQDSIFHIKVKTKNNSTNPLLFDLLDVFERAFTFILRNLQTYFNPSEINEMYLTLFQDNMLNGLNSPAVKLQADPKEVVDNILDMLYRFLISENNIDLEINDTFTVYIHVLSIDHLEYRKKNPPRKQTNKRKKTYGMNQNEKSAKKPFYWTIEIPNGYGDFPNIFLNKCLLVSVILGHLQNLMNKTKKVDKRFIYAQNIYSKLRAKQIYAGNIIQKELLKLSSAEGLSSGPFDISIVAPKLCNFYNCQLFIFGCYNEKSCLKALYPSKIDDSLEPIYLFELPNNENHVCFIRCISSFFKTFGRLCYYCGKHFKDSLFIHRCIP
jgi:hypothetical protein